MSTKEGRGGGDIFLIKPLQPALLILYCTTNLCPKKITLLFGYNASVCLAQSSTVQLRLFLSWYTLYAGSYDCGCIVRAFISYSIKSLLCTLHWLTLYIVRLVGVLCGGLIDRDIVRGRLTATWLVAAIVSESSSSIIPVVIILVILVILVIIVIFVNHSCHHPSHPWHHCNHHRHLIT